MQEYKVSIIVPVYNSEQYLRSCIESIINQSYKNLEIILIDDGSTDNSANIIKEYEKKDDRIIALFQNNFGAPSARNKGIEKSTGSYIMFFDSDDELYEDAIENLMNNIQDADIAMGNWCEIDKNGNLIRERKQCKNESLMINSIEKIIIDYNEFPGNKLYKSDIIKKNKIFFDNVRIAQDVNFYIKYIFMIKKCITIDNMILKYRLTPKSISRNNNLNLLDVSISIDKAEKYCIQNNKTLYKKNIFINTRFLHYYSQTRRCMSFNKIYRRITLDYFYAELKKIDKKDIKAQSKSFKKNYYHLLWKCKICKYQVGLELVNMIRKAKGYEKL